VKERERRRKGRAERDLGSGFGLVGLADVDCFSFPFCLCFRLDMDRVNGVSLGHSIWSLEACRRLGNMIPPFLLPPLPCSCTRYDVNDMISTSQHVYWFFFFTKLVTESPCCHTLSSTNQTLKNEESPSTWFTSLGVDALTFSSAAK